jgi:polysaccharide deacetylase family protein (PEP-CTERM system associated)
MYERRTANRNQLQPNDFPERPSTSLTGHMLSFDVEEFFQVESAAKQISRDDWPAYEKRLAPCVDRILALLADHQASATFFVLGWVAKHEPDIVSRIVAAGHEIASHGMDHRMLQHLTPRDFLQNLLESKNVLEDISGKAVIGYRAPTFSITRGTSWALDVLVDAGFLYDSSIFPIRHDRYGIPEAPRRPHSAVGPAGGTILEIPPLTTRAMGINWPIGGGGYLRLLPVQLVSAVLRTAQAKREPAMLYLHPWELDKDQPVLPMSQLNQWRHRLGLGRTESKLRFLLRRHTFRSVQTMLPALSRRLHERFVYSAV